jgi:acyl carrier protein
MHPLTDAADGKLKAAFVEAIGVNPDADFDAVVYGQTEGWDSVAHMALVSSVEAAFDIMLATDDVIDLSSFVKAKEILGKYGVSFD